MRLREMGEVDVSLSGSKTLELPRPDGAIIGFQIVHEGQIDGATLAAADDDAVFKLISFVEIEIPTAIGNVIIRGPARDLMMLARYQHSFWQSSIPTTDASDYYDGFLLWLGWPDFLFPTDHPWGIAREAVLDSITVKFTFAAATEYNTNATGVTGSKVYFSYVLDTEQRAGRLALIPNSNSYPVESSSEFTAKPVNFAHGARGAAGVLLRQEDTSAAADRVDGLVTKAALHHSNGVELWRQNMLAGRNAGLQWAGIDRAIAVTATPEGMDGTVLIPLNKSLKRSLYWPLGANNAISIEFDSAATVRKGQTNVTPASGDKLHALALGVVSMG